MEQKKTLWIALSAGVFLLTVFGAATLIYSSRTKNNVSAVSVKNSDALWVAPAPTVIDTNGSSDESGTSDETAPAVTSSLGLPAEGATDLENGYTSTGALSGAYQQEPGSSSQNAGTQADGVTVINTNNANYQDLNDLKNSQTTAPAPAQTVKPQNATAEKAMAQAQTTRKTETAAKKPAAGSSTAKKPAATAAASTKSASPAKTETKPAAKSVSTAATGTYWIQVSSYSAKKYADEARAELDKNQIPCEVFTFTKDDKLYYRVRVGPYTTKSEAEYWKKRIDAIPLFKNAGCYILNANTK